MRSLAGIASDAEVHSAPIQQLKKPYPGMVFGEDGAELPIKHTEDELSRLADLMYAALQQGGQEMVQNVFRLIPSELKAEFSYSRWEYVAVAQ